MSPSERRFHRPPAAGVFRDDMEMDMNTPITLDELAQLYAAANRSNAEYDAARKAKAERQVLAQLREASREANRAYAAAQQRYKRQQKAGRRAQMRTTMIRWYIDARGASL